MEENVMRLMIGDGKITSESRTMESMCVAQLVHACLYK